MANLVGLTGVDSIRWVFSLFSEGEIDVQPAQNATPSERIDRLALLSPALVNKILSFLNRWDLPRFAHTAKSNEELAVSHCIKRMKQCESDLCFTRIWPQAITRCRGPNRPFTVNDALKMDGAWEGTCFGCNVDDTAPFLGSNEQNALFAQKIPRVRTLQFGKTVPNLTPFALHCRKVNSLQFENSDWTGEEPIQADFSAFFVAFDNCTHLTDAGVTNLLSHCPNITTIFIDHECSISPHVRFNLEAASQSQTLNALIHGSKEPKPETKKAE